MLVDYSQALEVAFQTGFGAGLVIGAVLGLGVAFFYWAYRNV